MAINSNETVFKQKKKQYLDRIDLIAKESFNNEQKEIAKQIIESANENNIDSVYQLVTQRVKTGFVFDSAPEVNHNCVALVEENEELSIKSTEAIQKEPHILIIGENYDALKNLLSTYVNQSTGEGMVDIIYIDPPYNTEKAKIEGNDYKELVETNKFIYRDKFTRDGWLNMINERIKIASKIMRKDGLIIISLDDYEMPYFKVLCDDIFGEDNLIAILPTIMNLKGNQDQFGFAGTHEYTIVYTKNKNMKKNSKINPFGEFAIEDDGNDSWEKDDKGFFKIGATLKRTGKDGPREKRPTTYFPLLLTKAKKIEMITKDELNKIYNKEKNSFDDVHVNNLKRKYESKGYTFILPIDNSNIKTSWRWSYETIKKNHDEILINDNDSPYKKQRPQLTDLPSKKPKTLFYKPEYSSGNGTDLLKKIGVSFPNPKPIELLKDFFRIATINKDAIILDFFAGSGSTGQAVMELNDEDGGKRKFILVTNNENNIAMDTTLERLYRVIHGKGSKGEEIEWKYSTDKLSLIDNDLKVFEIKYYELRLNDFNKANELIPIAEEQFKKLNPNYKTKDRFDIYNELAALNPYKKV